VYGPEMGVAEVVPVALSKLTMISVFPHTAETNTVYLDNKPTKIKEYGAA